MAFEKLVIEIHNSGSAFGDHDQGAAEVARILREHAARIGEGFIESRYLHDENGNRCGSLDYIYDEEEDDGQT